MMNMDVTVGAAAAGRVTALLRMARTARLKTRMTCFSPAVTRSSARRRVRRSLDDSDASSVSARIRWPAAGRV